MDRLFGKKRNLMSFTSGEDFDRQNDISEALKILRDYPGGQIYPEDVREATRFLQQALSLEARLIAPIWHALHCEGDERAERYRVSLRQLVEWLARHRPADFALAVADWKL